MKKALFIRMDRIGDLVLTLPCDQLVSDQYECHWLTTKGLEFVMDATQPKRNYFTSVKEPTLGQFFTILKKIRKIKPEVSISYHVPWWINLCLWLAGVKTRAGVKSQWHSYLFLNRGLRQKRSRCEFHEMEYNYLLTEHAFGLKSDPSRWRPVELAADEQVSLPNSVQEPYAVVHPGMGGSALNWPTQSYIQFINELSQKIQIYITGTKTDEEYLAPLKIALKENPNVVWLDKQLNGSQLLKLLKHSKATVAPSTGVIHLSASLGAPSFGIYSPIKVHQAKRWGPKGKTVFSFEPEVDDEDRETIDESSQSLYMSRLDTETVSTEVLKHL